MGGSGGWMLVYAGQTAWRVFSGEEAGTQGDHGPLMVGQHWRLQEATTEHTGCCRRAPWLSWLTGTSPLTSSSKEWKWGVYTHTLPTIKECNYTKILHVGNGRRAVEEMLNSVRPRASVYQCTLQNSVEIVKPGSVFLLQYIIGEGLCVCVCVCPHWLEHNTLSHYKYMPSVLHNWIKSEATVPQNKEAVRLMRTRSGSEIQNSPSFY